MTGISVIVATYGEDTWSTLASHRAIPSLKLTNDDNLVLRHDPLGTRASSLNDAAALSEKDWLLFLDADDELAPGYITAMRNAIQNNPGRVLLTPSVQQIRKGRPRAPFFFPECDFRTGNWLVIGTLIQRELFMEIGGFREHPHGLEDWNLWARAVRAGATVVKVPDAVYKAHMNPRSKHHVLSRNRAAYMEAYETARKDAWG